MPYDVLVRQQKCVAYLTPDINFGHNDLVNLIDRIISLFSEDDELFPKVHHVSKPWVHFCYQLLEV